MPDVDIELLRRVIQESLDNEAPFAAYPTEFADEALGRMHAWVRVLDWLTTPDALRAEAKRLGINDHPMAYIGGEE